MEYIREQFLQLVALIGEKFDEIFLIAMAALFIVGIIVVSQLRGIDPIKFSFASKKNSYLSPFGRVCFRVFNAIGLLIILFMLSSLYFVSSGK